MKKRFFIVMAAVVLLLLFSCSAAIICFPEILYHAATPERVDSIEPYFRRGMVPQCLKKRAIAYASKRGDNDVFNYLLIKYYPEDFPTNMEFLCHCLNSKIITLHYQTMNHLSIRGGMVLPPKLKKRFFDLFSAMQDPIVKADILSVLTVCCWQDKEDCKKIVKLFNELLKTEQEHFRYSEIAGKDGSHIMLDGFYLSPKTINETMEKIMTKNIREKAGAK